MEANSFAWFLSLKWARCTSTQRAFFFLAMSNGYIKLHRKVIDSWVFADEKAFKLWVWLLMKASHKPKFVSIKTGRGCSTVEVGRGQLVTGRESIERETGINGRTAYDILKRFEKSQMTNTQTNTHYSLITIVNYAEYQDFDSADTDMPQATHQPNVQPSNTNNNDKKEKNIQSGGAEAPAVGVGSSKKRKKPEPVLSKERIREIMRNGKLSALYPLRLNYEFKHSDAQQIESMLITLNNNPKLIEEFNKRREDAGKEPLPLDPAHFLAQQFIAYKKATDAQFYVNPYRFNHEQFYLNDYE